MSDLQDVAFYVFCGGTVGNVATTLLSPTPHVLPELVITEIIVVVVSLTIFAAGISETKAEKREDWREGIENRVKDLENEVDELK